MISRRNLFSIGIVLLIGGLLLPPILSVVVRMLVADRNLESRIIYDIFFGGVFLSLCVGGPMIVLGIFSPSKRNPGGRQSQRDAW